MLWCMLGHLPIVFCGLYQVTNLGVHELENAFLRSFLIAPELFCGVQDYGPAG